MGTTARLAHVDSLRAIAALSIFAYHALFVTGHLTSGNYGFHLRIGVPLFYAISGLLLFLPFARSLVVGESLPAPAGYARRRLSRIVPAYWVALPIVAILLERADEVFSPSGIVTYFGFLQVYRLDTFAGGIGQAWTLCVEMSFYLFLPLFAYGLAVIARRGRGTDGRGVRPGALFGVVFALVGLSVIWKAAVIRHVEGDLAAALVPLEVLPASLDAFGLGMAVAVLVAARDAGLRFGAAPLSAKAVPALAVAVAAACFWAIGEIGGIGLIADGPLIDRGWQELAKKELEALFAGAMVLAAVAARPGAGMIGGFLSTALLRRAGEISYGIYLWHLLVLIVFAGSPVMGSAVEWIGGDGGVIGGVAGVATAFVVTVAVSVASWELIERRMIARAHGRSR